MTQKALNEFCGNVEARVGGGYGIAPAIIALLPVVVPIVTGVIKKCLKIQDDTQVQPAVVQAQAEDNSKAVSRAARHFQTATLKAARRKCRIDGKRFIRSEWELTYDQAKQLAQAAIQETVSAPAKVVCAASAYGCSLDLE
jgi:hypothetical protein